MADKKKPVEPKGPGDPCPSCGAELVAPVLVRPKPTKADPDPEPAPQGVAKCLHCDYVLTEPVKAEKAASSR
jgi:hypothetical protein